MRKLKFYLFLPLLIFYFYPHASFAQTFQKNVLRVSQPSPPVNLDWTISSSELDFPIIYNIQEGLLEISDQGKLELALAEKWDISEEGRLHRFKIRKNMVWSDGVALKAEHFIDAWRRLLSRATAAPYTYLFFQVLGAEEYHLGKQDFSTVGIREVNPLEIEIRLKRPSISWAWSLGMPATFPIRKELIEKHGNLWTKPGNLVSIGAFRLQSRDENKVIVLEKNPHYWKSRGNVSHIELWFGTETPPIDLLFEYTPERIPKHKEIWLKPARTKRLSFNGDLFPTSDLFFRQAIAYSIDRKNLARSLGRGYFTAQGLAPQAITGFSISGGLPFNPKKAKELFKPLGLQTSAITLLVPAFDSNRNENIKTAHFIKNEIQKTLNISLKLEIVESATQWPTLARSKTFSMILHDWSPDYPDPGSYYAVYSSRSLHTVRWSHPEYDRGIEAANENADPTRRHKLYQHADELLTQQYAMMIPLYYASEVVLVGPRVKHYKPIQPFRMYRLRDVTLKK